MLHMKHFSKAALIALLIAVSVPAVAGGYSYAVSQQKVQVEKKELQAAVDLAAQYNVSGGPVKNDESTYEKTLNEVIPRSKVVRNSTQSIKPNSTPVPNQPLKQPEVNKAAVVSVQASAQMVSSTPKNEVVSRGTESKVQLLSWFGKAQNIFDIGTIATVTDVETGISFKAKRTYGYNHADVETVSTADTQTLKKIAGGEWNWERRAVVVNVNGTRIAASMTAMPHAGRDSKPANEVVSGRSGGFGTGENLDAVKGNGMDGHFDIHFYQSKTHESNSVDSQHQAAVQRAYKSER